MDSKRLEDKVDKIADRIGNIDVTLAKQSVILEEHVKRTNLLEAKISPLEKQHNLIKSFAKIASFIGLGALLKLIHGILSAKGIQ